MGLSHSNQICFLLNCGLNKRSHAMKMFNDLVLRFEKPEWSHNPEFCLLDQLPETHPELYDHVKDDIMRGTKPNRFGRGDMPTVEQITRAALFKELRGLT